ncbi:MAG: hypothetical protein Q4P34_05675 [Tissierellia bacterium]|nr:hypothetical protein [Tissierellia bacterium]
MAINSLGFTMDFLILGQMDTGSPVKSFLYSLIIMIISMSFISILIGRNINKAVSE